MSVCFVWRKGRRRKKTDRMKIENINEVYRHIVDTDARIVICYGGRDSGKSYFVGGQYIPGLLCSGEYFRGAAVRKVFATHRDSCYQEVADGVDTLSELEEARQERLQKNARQRANRKIKKLKQEASEEKLPEDDKNQKPLVIDEKAIFEKEMEAAKIKMNTSGVKYKASPIEIEHENGNKLIFRGLDKPKKLKSIKGLNFIWVEEAEDLTREEFYELLMLLRGKGKQQIVLTFNPVDEGHFTNSMFVESPADEVLEKFADGEKKVWIKQLKVMVDGEDYSIKTLVLRTTYEDNKYISVERKAAIEQLANTDPFLYDVYRLGKFGTRGGRILINAEEMDFDKKGMKFEQYDNRGYAQDFGFNHGNCILAAAEKDNNLYVFDEIYGYNKDTAEWIAEADKKGLDKRLLMVCDSAEPDRIKTWVRAGYRAVGVKKGAGSVLGQIDRLKRYSRIYINSSCVNTLKQAREWKWMKKGERYIDVPDKGEDDAMAALRYTGDLFYDCSARMMKVGNR